jgi:uncharacterized protein (UPF0333 family)
MRAQTAFEYLMIFSIVLAIVGILTLYAGEMTKRNEDDIRIANAMTIVNKVVEAANIVYTQGEPSQITLSLYVPEGIESIEINDRKILVKAKVSNGITDIFAFSKAPLQGSISLTPGTKKVKVIAEEDYVNITEV